MEDGVGGRNDTLLSMGLLQIRIAATYISRLGLRYAPVSRRCRPGIASRGGLHDDLFNYRATSVDS